MKPLKVRECLSPFKSHRFKKKSWFLLCFVLLLGFSFNLSQFFKTNASALLKKQQTSIISFWVTEVLQMISEELEQDPF